MLSNYTARDRNVSADDCDDWMFVWMKCHTAKRSFFWKCSDERKYDINQIYQYFKLKAAINRTNKFPLF